MFYFGIIVVAATISAGWLGLRQEPKHHWLIPIFEWFGELGIFVGRVARAAVTPPYELAELVRQMDAIGSKSLPLVAMAGAATGVVMSLQTHDSFVRFGAKGMLPTVIAFALIRETGPIITGLGGRGRVCAGICPGPWSLKV